MNQKKLTLADAWNIVVSTARVFKGTGDEWDTINASLLALKTVVEPAAQQEAQANLAAVPAPVAQASDSAPASTPATSS